MKSKLSRRSILKLGINTISTAAIGKTFPASNICETKFRHILKSKKAKVVVVGAGSTGGWVALHLLRKGFEVVLIDQYGPGNNQSSSGGDTRLIRPYYDNQELYFHMALRSLQIWKDNASLFKKKILYQNGLIMFHEEKEVQGMDAALEMYKRSDLPIEKISPTDAAVRWPQISTKDLNHVLYDPSAGFLMAREGCREVVDLFQKEGGTFIHEEVKKEEVKGEKIISVKLGSGKIHEADIFVYAGGPWIIRKFPELTKKLRITRQGYFYFSPLPGPYFEDIYLPTWFNRPIAGGIMAYGIPGNASRGFKVAIPLSEDITEKFDTYDRYMKPEELQMAQKLIKSRFPLMKGRPVIEQRICQYTETPDKHFILDQHPETSNLWILSCCSGHGYKHGASFGEIVAGNISGEIEKVKEFSIGRLLN